MTAREIEELVRRQLAEALAAVWREQNHSDVPTPGGYDPLTLTLDYRDVERIARDVAAQLVMAIDTTD